MILKRVTLEPFGGVSGRSVEFKPGLNVVLGANEAGKSTMVNALFAALFLPSAIKRNAVDWKDYLSRFMPYGGGDTISVTVEFVCRAGKQYTLTRSWGETRLCRLVLDNGAVVTNEETAQAMLAEILGHGRGTYEGILFARQDEMVKTVEMLRQNREAASTLGDALRTALFEAGGVSVDALALALEEAKKELLDNWDVDRGGPRNNRGIDNPYQKNVGRLLAAHYGMEQMKRRLRSALEAEERLDALTAQLAAANREKAAFAAGKGEMEKLEGDMRARSRIEPRLEMLAIREEKLKDVNSRWPAAEERLGNLDIQREENQRKVLALNAELEEARSAQAARALRESYRAVKPLADDLLLLVQQVAVLPAIAAADLHWLEETAAQIALWEAQLQAMKLTARFTAQRPVKIRIQAGMGREEERLVEGTVALAGEGRLIIAAADWTLEVQAGQGDVEAIIRQIESTLAVYTEKLQAMGVADFCGAKKHFDDRTRLEARMAELQAEIAGILRGQAYADVELAVAALLPEKQCREVEAILAEQAGVAAQLRQTAEQAKELRVQISRWREEYGSYDAVMDILAELKGEARGLQEQLARLSPLPEQFTDAASFLEALDALRKEERELDARVSDLKIAVVSAQKELPDESAEELTAALRESESRFERYQKEARALLRAEAEFNRIVGQLDRNTFIPLVEAFTRYLPPATGNRYKAASLEGALPTHIAAADGRELPVDLLSAGTTRGIALALRLAMGEFLLRQAGGFMMMDDPLVELDPERKKLAAAMAGTYAEGRQLIITTCDPDTAMLLGGNQIQM